MIRSMHAAFLERPQPRRSLLLRNTTLVDDLVEKTFEIGGRERTVPLSKDASIAGHEVRLRHAPHSIGDLRRAGVACAVRVRDVELLDERQRICIGVLYV